MLVGMLIVSFLLGTSRLPVPLSMWMCHSQMVTTALVPVCGKVFAGIGKENVHTRGWQWCYGNPFHYVWSRRRIRYVCETTSLACQSQLLALSRQRGRRWRAIAGEMKIRRKNKYCDSWLPLPTHYMIRWKRSQQKTLVYLYTVTMKYNACIP